jgi:hypothetical protein
LRFDIAYSRALLLVSFGDLMGIAGSVPVQLLGYTVLFDLDI